jgi:tetratricopeptide (TPR) repeat protein
MKRFVVLGEIFGLLFIALTAVSSYAQVPKDPYLQVAHRAELARREGDYDTAIKFYTEAIDLFPKIDAFTPKNRKINLGNGKFLETPYTGLDGLYLSHAKAYLQKRNFEAAKEDYVNTLTIIKYEVTKNLDKAKKYRDSVDISKAKKIGLASSHDSDFARSFYF